MIGGCLLGRGCGGVCTQGIGGRSCLHGQLGVSGSGFLSFLHWVTLQPLFNGLTGPWFSHLYNEGLDMMRAGHEESETKNTCQIFPSSSRQESKCWGESAENALGYLANLTINKMAGFGVRLFFFFFLVFLR